MRIAFLLTGFLFAFFTHTQAQNNQSKHKTTTEPVVDFCTLFDQASKYEGQVVKTHAYMSYTNISRVDGGDTFLFSPKCNNEDYFAVVNAKSRHGWSYLSQLPPEQDFILDVTLQGRLRTSIIPSYGHLSWSRAEMEVAQLDTIKNVTKTRPSLLPNLDSTGRIIETGRSIKNVNAEVSLWIFSARHMVTAKPSIHSEFVLTDELGNAYTLDTIELFRERQMFQSIGRENMAVRINDLTATSDGYKALGSVEIGDNRSVRLKFVIENTFKLDGGSPILIRSVLTRR